MQNPMRQSQRSYNFYIRRGNYSKAIINAIKSELPDQVSWKQQLIWTVERFDFKGSRYSQIILSIEEYGVQLTFKTQDEGIEFFLTIPELATDAPARKKWLGIF